MGLYIFLLNVKSTLNRLFLLVTISLSIWSFAFSMCFLTTDLNTAVSWRMFAAIGWSTIFSFLIHFFILLTDRSELLKKRWVYILIYLPAVVFVIVFCLYFSFARQQYNLAYSDVGWITVEKKNIWAQIYNVYYVFSTILGVYLLGSWGKKSKSADKKKMSFLMIASFAFSVLLGTVTETIVNVYTSVQCPQLAPFLAVLPISVVCYVTKKYGLLIPKDNFVAEPGKILNKENKGRIHQIMSVSFFIGALLNFISQFYFNKREISSILFFSIFLIFVGILIQIIRKLPMKEDKRGLLFTATISLTVPIITFEYISTGSTTVWAAPFIFVMICVVFNKRQLLYALGISVIITQFIVWIKVPAVYVRVDGADYLVRIAFFGITILMAYYINQIYINRLKENENQIKFQKMISTISADLIGVNEFNIDEKIDSFLNYSGDYFDLDRIMFVSLSKNFKTYEWYKQGMESAIEYIPNIIENNMKWWKRQLYNKDIVHISDIEMLPEEATKEKAILEELKVKSLYAIPLTRKGRALGFLIFISNQEKEFFNDNHKKLLKILSNILTDGLIKVEAEKEICYMAYYDSLSGIPNRTLFKNRLDQEIALAKRDNTLIGVIFIDLDSFKLINDTIGHFGGNEVIKEVANRLTACTRKHDTVARFGGDEFLVLVNQVTEIDDIEKIANEILISISKPISIQDQEFFTTASMGISIYPYDGEDTETLIKNADLAMYSSKENGKHQYTICSSKIKDEVSNKTKITNHLYRAIEKNEFVLYYQPQICTATKEIVGVEALLRWDNHEFGMIPPKVFMPLAEQTGLIDPIGKWVLETACRQNKKWQEEGLPPIRMSVNLAAEQFQDKKLISFVNKVLCETKLDAKYLELEITESAAVDKEKYKYTIQMLNELKALGVSISIDDFGTEYSSLGRLKTLPIDQLKIDMQFVQNISESKKDEAIVKTIIQLAKNLELNVIAEGVEKEEQYEFLKREMCDEIQGYYFYKPMPVSELEKILFSQK
ncbi:EAL domain-containing protein [Ruminiclostridium herbifermentans]|uniref:EAL domain-containing protein n=1 Tax=Ruminiclostridium herbifermentans TaxID=2488810 RepID=A0A7H1VS57_9FIRM|nr:EAL domain-containing protein [Ruminiclostridium herbifermentans]